ncbi:MAG: outer membrane lipoprotein chaperone LolA [Woeseiaceae bacterium]
MTSIRRYWLVLVSCLFCGTAAHAQQEENDAGRMLVEDFLNNVNTMSGRFEQQLVDASDAIIEESSGTLDIRRPGQFRWSYKAPYEQMLIADGINIWSYDVDLEQVTVKGQSDALGSTPAILLGGSSEVLDDFEYVGSFSDRGTVWVRLRPKDTDSGFNMVELGFTDGDLTRMLFADNLEQTTLIALLDVTFNEPIDDQQFAFSPPAGVDLVGIPVTKSAADL